MTDILERIVAYKKEEIVRDQSVASFSTLDFLARTASPPRGFYHALAKKREENQWGLIAEIKKASPSKGVIREDFNAAHLAQAYREGGATCLSVLTDVPSFQGHPEFLTQAREAVALPCLRKDFILDPYQVAQSRSWGADCILLILSIVSQNQAIDIVETASNYGMDVLCEVHTEEELSRALLLETRLIGINNRDLSTFTTDLRVTERLAPLVPQGEGYVVISESGLSTAWDLQRLSAGASVTTFLIGEALMRCSDVAKATKKILTLPLD